MMCRPFSEVSGEGDSFRFRMDCPEKSLLNRAFLRKKFVPDEERGLEDFTKILYNVDLLNS